MADQTVRPPLFEVDFGDAEIVVREHPDGKFTVDVNDERVIATVEQMQAIVAGFVAIGRAKGWKKESD